MSEPIDWLPDGTPYSPRFGDRYHSENGGLAQAQNTFLQGCGLPEAWAGQDQWRVLETGFGFGLNFLVTWAAWRADLARPRILHFISVEAWPVAAADLLRATAHHAELAPLAQQLHDQWWGLLPGVHRLSFEEGRVLLTLYVGDAQEMLRQQAPTADSVYLDGFSPKVNPDIWSVHTLKAVARCCHRGTRLATWSVAHSVRDALTQCGFVVHKVPGVPPKRHNLQARYDPHWEPRPRSAALEQSAAVSVGNTGKHCIVLGAGLAGAATAASLARRGWRVQVLDQGAEPAAGASSLPAGVFAPHVSPDDSVLSRLSRSGVRTTLLQARQRLQQGLDWAPEGVLEHRVDGTPGLPKDWAQGPGADWSVPTPAERLAQAGLPADAAACWHRQGGWIRPGQLVRALLREPGIEWLGQRRAASLRKMAPEGAAQPCWQVLGAQGQVLAEAPLVVVAAGFASHALLEQRYDLRAVRGQVSLGLNDHQHPAPAPFPVNGHGNLVPAFAWAASTLGATDAPQRGWVMGSTFERGMTTLPPAYREQTAAHHTHWDKLQTLLPPAAKQLAPLFETRLQKKTKAAATCADAAEPEPGEALCESAEDIRQAGGLGSWGAVRCTTTDRLPLVGPVNAKVLPGLWVCTAMGARGLTLALLCGELAAARLNDEPLPLDAKLARALDSERM